jgi:uncharacterized protein (DUF1501 family)
MTLSRRSLLTTATGGAIMTLAPGMRVAFGADTGVKRDTLVVLFLRFGMDGLQLVAPAQEDAYVTARPSMAVSTTGSNPADLLGKLDGVSFFLNPSAGPLKQLYDTQKLAVVHAAGLPTASRSHFEDQAAMELGRADGEAPVRYGWLTRHLQALPGDHDTFAAISNGRSNATSLIGFPGTMALNDPFGYFGAPYWAEKIYSVMGQEGTRDIDIATRKSIEVTQTLRERVSKITPNYDRGPYPYGPLADSLRNIAQFIKLDMGIEVITAEYGGWDHHQNLTAFYSQQADQLSRSLAAFAADLGPAMDRVTLVTMTEFGRRFAENSNAGLEHGAASVMLALGNNINGGRIYGNWPGIAPKDLDQGDLRVTTDYRTVLSEILSKRHSQANTATVFPSLKYKPLGIVKGTDASEVA